ncbi:MAG: hypothetical protein WCI60_00130 [bacterium]
MQILTFIVQYVNVIIMTQEYKQDTSSFIDPFEEAPDNYEAAGRWWARQLLNPKFDNGGKDKTNLMSMQISTLLASSKRTEIEPKIRDFSKALSELLIKRGVLMVSVDYHPDQILADAAKTAGIEVDDISTFPWKTEMIIYDESVLVSEGPGAEFVQIWPPVEE